MTMWAFAKLWPQSRCTTVFVFTFPTILVRSISLKIILFLDMEDWNAKHDHIWGPFRTPSNSHALQIWLYAALLAVQGSCRLQNLYFPCHFACNHQRSESRQIQAKNSEELFQDCMVGIAATNPVQISANTYSQHNISWWPHPISRKSSRFHHHACNGLEGFGVGWDNFDSSSSFGSGRFWSNANLHICLGIGTNLRGFLGLFCWLGIVVGRFFVEFCGEASTGLGECDPESLQFLFSGSRVVPC